MSKRNAIRQTVAASAINAAYAPVSYGTYNYSAVGLFSEGNVRYVYAYSAKTTAKRLIYVYTIFIPHGMLMVTFLTLDKDPLALGYGQVNVSPKVSGLQCPHTQYPGQEFVPGPAGFLSFVRFQFSPVRQPYYGTPPEHRALTYDWLLFPRSAHGVTPNAATTATLVADLGAPAKSIAFNPLTRKLYVTAADNYIYSTSLVAFKSSVFAAEIGGTGDAEGLPSLAKFDTPKGIAVGASGTMYVVDSANQKVRRLTPTMHRGVVSWFSATLGSLPLATFSAVAVDDSETYLYLPGSDGVVRRMRISDGFLENASQASDPTTANTAVACSQTEVVVPTAGTSGGTPGFKRFLQSIPDSPLTAFDSSPSTSNILCLGVYNNLLWVMTSLAPNSIYSVDIATNTRAAFTLSSPPVGYSPGQFTIDPVTGTLYTLEPSTGRVYVVA